MLPADLTELHRARAFVREHAARAGFVPPALGEIELAVTEAVSNVMRHAYGGDPSQQLVVQVIVDERELVVEVLDQGESPEKLPDADPDLDDPGPGGYGLYLIRTVMDEVEWLRQPGVNVLRLRRRRAV